MRHTKKIVEAGVYQYSFKNTNRKYIGSSFNLRKRHSQHMSLLKNGKHYITDWQNAFIEYGLESMSYEILEFVDNSSFIKEGKLTKDLIKLIEETEQKYLDKYYAQEYLKEGKDTRFFKLLYNKTPIAGITYSLSHKEVHSYTLEGKYIQSYINASIASMCTGIDCASIKKVCYKQRSSAGNLIWSYKKEYVITNYVKKQARKIYQYDKNKNLIKCYDSITAAKNETGIDVRKEKKTKTKTQGGFYWLFENEKFPKYQKEKLSNIIVNYKNQIKSIDEWAKEIGITGKVLKYRLNNWSIEEAMTVKKYKHPTKKQMEILQKDTEY